MAKLLFIVIYLVFLSISLSSGQEKFQEMNHAQIEKVIIKYSKSSLILTEKMNRLSEFFLGMYYNFKCVGDGPYAILEPWPLVNFKETNCMSFCEHVLALSISDSWDNFFNNLQHIRYKDGLIGMKTRNHYTMADWLPQNSWILEDASAKVGGKYTKKIIRTISHKTFFAGKGIKDMRDILPDRTIKLDYVPLDKLDKIKDRTRTGDIIALLYAKLDNIFSAHMLMIIEKDGKKVIRESSNSKMSTFDTPYDEWVKQKQEKSSEKYLGVAFMRVKEELNKSGKIIKPWEIKTLKGKK